MLADIFKTRLEPTMLVASGQFSRTFIYTPGPWKGSIGVARGESLLRRTQNKNDS